ncbi:MAG: hypothetical protein WCS06_05075 [Dysgonamonadaceae bacterium]
MATEHQKLLIDLEVRVKQLMVLCDRLKDENMRLKNDARLKQKKIDSINDEFSQLKTKYDNLKMVRTITAASVDVEQAQKKLSGLVQEVDKCINLLK